MTSTGKGSGPAAVAFTDTSKKADMIISNLIEPVCGISVAARIIKKSLFLRFLELI